MGKKVISQRKRLAAILVSLTILLVGTLSLCESMSIDYYSVIDTIQKIIPASIVMGGLGWVMGMILDRPNKTQKNVNYNNVFLNDVKNEFNDETIEDIADESMVNENPQDSENSTPEG